MIFRARRPWWAFSVPVLDERDDAIPDGDAERSDDDLRILSLFRTTVEGFMRSERLVAGGYAHDYTYDYDEKVGASEKFVIKMISIDTARPCDDVDRAPRQAIGRYVAAQAVKHPIVTNRRRRPVRSYRRSKLPR